MAEWWYLPALTTLPFPIAAHDDHNFTNWGSLGYLRHVLGMISRINEIDVPLSINAKRSAAFRKLLRVEHLDHRTLRTDLPDAVFDHVNIAVFADYQIIQMHTSNYWRHRSVTLQSPNAIVICICEINATLPIQINSGSDVCLCFTRAAEKHRHRRN